MCSAPFADRPSYIRLDEERWGSWKRIKDEFLACAVYPNPKQRSCRLANSLASAAVELTEGDLRDIGTAASRITVHGARYSEAAQRMINR
jgi:hypothetical protein